MPPIRNDDNNELTDICKSNFKTNHMKSIFNDKLSLLIIGLSLLVGGIIYWTIPIDDIALLSRQFIVKWCLPVILIGLISFPIGKKRPLNSSILITIGFVSAIIVRIIYDTVIIDPTSHNLWPFEIVISICITFPIAFIGSTISFLAFRKRVEI